MSDTRKNHVSNPQCVLYCCWTDHISWYEHGEVRFNCSGSQGYFWACQYESGLKLRTSNLLGEDFHLNGRCSEK